MSACLERRGPEGTHYWREGPAALAHTLLATTPESLVERLPLTDETSGCTITADARLDNRDELITELGIGANGLTVGDGELILRSYLLWGEECPRRLLGDFAFAIWDPRKGRLFAARDHMGMRQFIYHHDSRGGFAFATAASGVLAGLDRPTRINSARIADFLDDLEGLDFTSTFFEGVFRLPPAHWLCVDASGLVIRKYWDLTPGPQLKLESDQAYADAFLAVFRQAVACRLRSSGRIGAMLSGGIDSNAATAVAATAMALNGTVPVKTFSAVALGDELCKETRFIRLSTDSAGYDATFVDRSELEHPEPELVTLVTEGAEPFDGQMTMARMLFLEAHRQGVRVMLHGASADIVLTPGHRAAQLFGSGQFLKAWREAKGRERFWGPGRPAWKTLVEAAWGAFVPGAIKMARHRLLDRWNGTSGPGRSGLCSTEFATEIDLAGRRRAFRANFGTGASLTAFDRARSMQHPGGAAGRERYDRVASEVAIELRDPFIDIRVINFCLSLPSSQLQHEGWPKVILRRAMEGLVPDAIRWRSGKEHLGLSFTATFLDRWDGWRRVLKQEWPQLYRYVALSFRYIYQSSDVDISVRSKLVMLGLWLSRSDRRGDGWVCSE